MTELLQRKLSDSKTARWSALLVVSFTMMCGYFMMDVMAPLEDLLEKSIEEGGLGWTSSDYGLFTSAYGWFNVFLLMLFFGGIILDKMGVRFTGLLSSILMIAGALIKFYAVSEYFPLGGTLLGINSQVIIAGIGFAIFGVGAETMGITASKIVVKWFTGYELALAMGFQVAMARIGTAAAMMVTLPVAQKTGHLSYPILMGAITLCIGTLAYLVFCVMDRKLDASTEGGTHIEVEDSLKFKDIKLIVINKGFWLITLLCLLFYSGIFPFMKYATKIMIYKYNVDPYWAGAIPSLLPFGTILLTPLFGSIYDRMGKGATLMIIGSVMLIFVHLLFALPILNIWWFAVIIMLVLGVAFSLVPSAMWPSVPKIIPQRYLGTAYSLIFLVQNIGLSLVPLLIGWVIDTYSTQRLPDGSIVYDFTIPMVIFTLFGVLALFVAILLKVEDKRQGYGLEQANIQE